jgi:hypothetical protein
MKSLFLDVMALSVVCVNFVTAQDEQKRKILKDGKLVIVVWV